MIILALSHWLDASSAINPRMIFPVAVAALTLSRAIPQLMARERLGAVKTANAVSASGITIGVRWPWEYAGIVRRANLNIARTGNDVSSFERCLART
jgi:hypothetical protein